MKKILFLALTPLLIHTAEKLALVNNTATDPIITPHLTLQRAGAKQAADFVNLVSDLEVSRYMFVAPLSQEKLNAMTQSTFKTKIFAPLFFALPEFAQRKLAGAGPRWIIKDNLDKSIGSLSLSTVPQDVKNFLESKGIDSTNYENLGLILKPSAWNKGYAKETVFTALSRIFNNPKFAYLKGVTLCVNTDHQYALSKLISSKTNHAKAPVKHHGQVYLPHGFHKLVPDACTAECFTISKEDFMPLLGNSNNNN
ncbi:hypothetical protein Noda2021_09230 [Candidatus Dependentiae bacterium Noda2021]|nr:hypothetical protein Noda2021_09230 [Candidatus Dependentiae bacterium Noda2021]